MTYLAVVGDGGLAYYVLFNSISGGWEHDNERMCVMELRVRMNGLAVVCLIPNCPT